MTSQKMVMVAFLLLAVLTVASTTQNVVVETREVSGFDIGLLEKQTHLVDTVVDFFKGPISSDGYYSPSAILSRSGLWQVAPQILANVMKIVHDLSQEDDVMRIIQRVQSIPKMAIECLLNWTTENFKNIGPSFDLVLQALHKNNILDVEQIKTSLLENGLQKLFLQNNIFKADKLQEFLSGDKLQLFFFQAILPMFIEMAMIMVANHKVYEAVVTIFKWILPGLENVYQCLGAYVNRNIVPLIDEMTTE